MKKLKLRLLLCFAIPLAINAQNKTLDCDFNFREALFFLEGNTNFKKDSLKSIKFLKPCLKIDHDKSQLLMARLYNAKQNEKNYKKAFKLLKKSAKQGNTIAMADLGIMYKYGNGCKLNFNKARKWFKKSANLGNDKALYSLGYLYLKGFGDVQQNYKKATDFFTKSKHPMAKYWLGVCYFYGYGVSKDISKANKLLGTNYNTSTQNSINNSSNKDTIITTTITSNTLNEVSHTINSKIISNKAIIGAWKGTLLQLDWSSQFIENKTDIDIEFKEDALKNITYVLKLNKQKYIGLVSKFENELYFENLKLNLPHNAFKKEIPNSLIYHILSSTVSFKNIGDKHFLTGRLDSYIKQWQEAGKPLQFVLQKKEGFNNNDTNLSDTALQALASQEDSFIKLYPNPFKNDLIISYVLDKKSQVSVRVSDVKGLKNTILEKGKLQNKGKHNYFLNGNNLEKGLYIVNVRVNNSTKTRLIIKK